MFMSAELAKLNQYVDDQNFQNVIDQITAAQDEGITDFEVDVNLLDDDEISDLNIALLSVGYMSYYDKDAAILAVRYE
jgi:subtilisin-like proprotein convertase family protein